MTELETLLLQQLEQQQRDSEQLVNGLSAQLERLQTALKEQQETLCEYQKTLSQQQSENRQLRQEVQQLDQRNSKIFNDLMQRCQGLSEQLESFGNKLRK